MFKIKFPADQKQITSESLYILDVLSDKNVLRAKHQAIIVSDLSKSAHLNFTGRQWDFRA